MSDLRASPYEKKEILFTEDENADNYVRLMNSFLAIEDNQKFVCKLKEYQQKEWLRGPDDISEWIPVLNRINDLFKEIAEKYHLNIEIPNLYKPNLTESINNSNVENKTKISYDAFLTQLPKDTETFILDMINFILFLLENTFGSSVDSSVDGILPFLNVPKMEIKIGCVKVSSILSLRSYKIYSFSKLLQKDFITKSSIIASSLLCSTPINTEKTTSSDLFDFLTKLSSKAFNLPEGNELIIPENSFLPFSFQYYSEKNDCSKIFKLDKETIIHSSYNDLLSLVKEQKLIPEHYWFKLSIELYLAKTFATTKNKLNLKNDAIEIKTLFDLLNPFVQLKFYCTSFTFFSIDHKDPDSLMFVFDENLFNCLGKLTLSGYSSEQEREESSLQKITYSALFALECLSESDILRDKINKHIFGEGSYVHFVKLIERIKIALTTGKNIDTKYNVQFFTLLKNLSSTFDDLSVNSYIVYELTKILIIPDCKDYTTLWCVSDLLDACIDKTDSMTVFENAGAYTLFIDKLSKEIDFCIENTNMDKVAEYYIKVYQTIPFKQLSFLKFILKQVLNIINLDSGDRVKKLLNTPILNTLNKILLNKDIFGFTLVSQGLNIVSVLLNKGSTSFQMLQKAGTISIFLDNFQHFVNVLPDLFLLSVGVLSSLCVNKDISQEVISKNILQYLFEPLKNVELARDLVGGMDTEYVNLLDEMYNDHPDLQEYLENEFLNVLNKFDKGEYEKNLFMEDKNGNYFDSESENWYNKEIPDSLASDYDYTNVGILNKMSMMVLSTCKWTRVFQNLNIEFVLKCIFKEGIPFSFGSSETQNALIDVINDTDDAISDNDLEEEYLLDREKTLNFFMDAINNCLQNMTEFINYDDQNSFFLNASKEELLKVSNNLNLLNSILGIFFDGFIDYDGFSCLKFITIKKIAEENEKGISKTFFLLGNLFTKILRENTLLQDILLPQQDADTTPNINYFISIRKDKSLDNTDFEESFLNNIFMIRTWLSEIQFNTVFFFKSVLKNLLIEEKTLDSIGKFNQIKNMETVMMNVIHFLTFLADEGEVHEILIGVEHLENLLLKNDIFNKYTEEGIVFSIASLFYRFRGNELLFKIVMKMITLMTNRVGIQFIDIDKAKIYNKDIKSLAPLVLQQCLELLSLTTKIKNYEVEDQELEQTQFEELFKNIKIDSSTYCDELKLQTRALNSFELKKLVEKENLLKSLLNKDRKLTDKSLNSILDFILSMTDIKEIISDNKDIPFLISGYTKHFQAFREVIQRPDEITDDDLWEKVYEHLVYSYENEKNCNLELLLNSNKYSSSLETLTDDFESFKSMPAPLVSTYYPKDVNKTDNLLLNNVKSFLSNTETTDKTDIKCELLKLYPNCKTKIEEFYKTINELLTKKL
ncbi:hypothetical protein ACO0SA_004229 [Hanseniaspora valbyensis]